MKFVKVRPEIIAGIVLVFAPLARASLAPDIGRVGTLEALNGAGAADIEAVDGEGGRLLPLRFADMPRASYFSVDPSLKTLLLSREFVAEHHLWDYKFEREILLPQAGGGLVAGDLVRYYVLMVGAKALRDVEAVICDECDETAGSSLLEKLNTNSLGQLESR